MNAKELIRELNQFREDAQIELSLADQGQVFFFTIDSVEAADGVENICINIHEI